MNATTPPPSQVAAAAHPGGGVRRPPRASVSGFANVKRYHDPRLHGMVAKILPGEYYVTRADELVATVLGSCVSACIWDPEAGIGGMNHFMIPEIRNGRESEVVGSSEAARYGMYAMELLINAILKAGGDRSRMLVKLAGGGHVIESNSEVGANNVRFARHYLAAEGLPVVAEHVGGDNARKLVFHPLTGRTRVLELSTVGHGAVVRRERDYASTIRPDHSGGVELFEETS